MNPAVAASPEHVARLRGVLKHLSRGASLDASEAGAVLRALTSNEPSDALKSAVLTALRMKGETAEELHGFAEAMLAVAVGPMSPTTGVLADTCGTGGDLSGSYNVSTATALLVASLGVQVAKHGNRSVSSRCGSADLIEALGIEFAGGPTEAARAIALSRFAFLFAPGFHPATKAVASVRRELAVGTIFNLLGPLVNPARPTHQLIGANSVEAARKLAASCALGNTRAFVVHGAEGFDEATTVGPFLLLRVRDGNVEEETVDPRDFGFATATTADLAGGDALDNAARTRQLFAGERGPLRDTVLLNTALVLLLCGEASGVSAAIERGANALDGGRAERFLNERIEFARRTERRP